MGNNGGKKDRGEKGCVNEKDSESWGKETEIVISFKGGKSQKGQLPSPNTTEEATALGGGRNFKALNDGRKGS